MSRFVFFILLNYILVLQIRFGFSKSNDPITEGDCSCDVEVDVIKTFMKELEHMRKSTDKIEKHLTTNRAANPSSCMEAAANSLRSGIYKVKLEKLNITELEVFCEEEVDFGGWLVIQRRQSGSVNFTRNWHDYKEGFGDLTGNYWIGLEKLHALTSSCEQELYIQMKRNNRKEYYARYSEFLVGHESESYALKKLGNYSGNAGDSLSYHLESKFSTYDRDNAVRERLSCEEGFEGGWWFYNCYYDSKYFVILNDMLNYILLSNLNGPYGDDEKGVNWDGIERYKSLSFAQMMIRPTQNCWRRLLLSNANRYN